MANQSLQHQFVSLAVQAPQPATASIRNEPATWNLQIRAGDCCRTRKKPACKPATKRKPAGPAGASAGNPTNPHHRPWNNQCVSLAAQAPQPATASIRNEPATWTSQIRAGDCCRTRKKPACKPATKRKPAGPAGAAAGNPTNPHHGPVEQSRSLWPRCKWSRARKVKPACKPATKRKPAGAAGAAAENPANSHHGPVEQSRSRPAESRALLENTLRKMCWRY
jgi:hypothetical protein